MASHVRNFDAAVSPSSKSSPLDILTTKAARAAFALPFAIFGLFHFLNASAMAGMVPIPGGVFWIYFTGAALIAGSLGILTGILGRLAALGLSALLVTFIVGVHLPGLSNPQMQQMATMGLLKDVSLLGGALTWAGLLGKRS
jgi:putative oxidoreductase